MIAKKVKNDPKNTKPKSWQIQDLVDYIRHPQNINPAEKVEYSGSRNFISTTHSGQRTEMISLASETVRSKMPVQHWIFSWKEGEQPSVAQVEEMVDIFLKGMGLEEHQVVFGLHNNTENYHLHIAVNRVHPDTLKVIQPHKGFDIEAAHRIVAIAENTQGWEAENHGRYVVLENGDVAKRQRSKEIKPKQPALDFEHARGEKSAQRIAQERGYAIFTTAKTWDELHKGLDAAGLRFERKGSGAILFVGDIAIKASSVDRKFSMSNLIKRFGEYSEGRYSNNAEINTEPISELLKDDWLIYQAQKHEHFEDKSASSKPGINLHHLRQTNINQDIKNNKYCSAIQNIIKYFSGTKFNVKAGGLKRKAVRRLKGFPRFETWLRQEINVKKAEQWRYRNTLLPLNKQVTLASSVHEGEPRMKALDCDELTLFKKYNNAIGADKYRVTCIKIGNDGDKKTFILDKGKGISSGFTVDEMEARFAEILRIERRGENVYYTPLSGKKHHILVDDMTQDSLEQMLADGYKPAIILESSPNNFQCILTIKKLGSPFDREVGNRLTERLNRTYGDLKLSGCVHPHRAPGFRNYKSKHRREDDSFPSVRLVLHEKQECPIALAISQEIDADYAKQNILHKKQTTVLSVPVGHPAEAYQAHLVNIRQHLSVVDHSRVDAMIALRMRSNGHSQQAVVAAILECAQSMRGGVDKNRDWHRYAERTAAYAFGVAGDRDLQKYAKFHDHWRTIEGLSKTADKGRHRLR